MADDTHQIAHALNVLRAGFQEMANVFGPSPAQVDLSRDIGRRIEVALVPAGQDFQTKLDPPARVLSLGPVVVTWPLELVDGKPEPLPAPPAPAPTPFSPAPEPPHGFPSSPFNADGSAKDPKDIAVIGGPKSA